MHGNYEALSYNPYRANKTTRLMTGGALPNKLGLGIGYNWFDFLGKGGYYGGWKDYPLGDPSYPAAGDTRGWEAVRQGLDELKPGFIRFGLPPDPHVGADGVFQAGTVHMWRLSWLNDWAVRNGCTILLDTFTIPEYYGFAKPQPPYKTFCMNMAPRDNDEYATHFIVPLFEHIVNAEKLEAVRLFNPVNEPMEYGVFQTPEDGPDEMAHYVDMYRAMREALDAAGITRERIGLCGLDNTDAAWPRRTMRMLALGTDIDPYVDAYSIHYYSARFDQLTDGAPMNHIIDHNTRIYADYCHSRGKALYAAEIGTFNYGMRDQDPAGAASSDACLTVSEAVVRGMNQGLGAFAFWCLFNPNTIDGWWGIMRVEDGKLEKAAYPFHFYGLLSRYAKPGSTIYPCVHDGAHLGFFSQAKDVHGTTFETPDGDRVIFLTNNNRSYCHTVELTLPSHWGDTRFVSVTTDRVRLMDKLESVRADPDGNLQFVVRPFSLTVLYHSSGI